jgi:hypothetical protein
MSALNLKAYKNKHTNTSNVVIMTLIICNILTDIQQRRAYRTTLPIITNFIAKCNLILFYYQILTIYFNTILIL